MQLNAPAGLPKNMSLDEAALAVDPSPELGSSCTEPAKASGTRQSYLRALSLAFALFNSVRIVTYIPTIWAIHASGDSSQYSLWTWVTWIGANATMAAWLFENNDRRLNSASTVSAANALMCLATSLTIVYFRM
jgi:hypothetical protein